MTSSRSISVHRSNGRPFLRRRWCIRDGGFAAALEGHRSCCNGCDRALDSGLGHALRVSEIGDRYGGRVGRRLCWA
jgi:hypothetical protein